MSDPVTRGLLLYPDVVEVMEHLDAPRKAALLDACIGRWRGGRAPDFGGDEVLEIVWLMVEPSVARAVDAYAKRSERARGNALSGKKKGKGRG